MGRWGARAGPLHWALGRVGQLPGAALPLAGPGRLVSRSPGSEAACPSPSRDLQQRPEQRVAAAPSGAAGIRGGRLWLPGARLGPASRRCPVNRELALSHTHLQNPSPSGRRTSLSKAMSLDPNGEQRSSSPGSPASPAASRVLHRDGLGGPSAAATERDQRAPPGRPGVAVPRVWEAVAKHPGLDETASCRSWQGTHHTVLTSLCLSQIQKRVPHRGIRPDGHETSNQIPWDGGRV